MEKREYTNEQQNEKMQQNKFWLQNSVNEVVEPMMLSIVMQQQKNPDQNIDQVSIFMLFFENGWSFISSKFNQFI